MDISLVFALPAVVYSWSKYKEFQDRRKVHSVLHVQSKTEDAETMDFAITLFQDESPDSKMARIQEVFEVSERRRKFNNDRLQKIYAEQQEKLRGLKKEA